MSTKDIDFRQFSSCSQELSAYTVPLICREVAPTTVKEKSLSKRGVKATRKRKQFKAKKPKGFPKRPLSAYNIFFHHEQKRMLHEVKEESESIGSPYGKTGIATLARMVATKWKAITPTEKEFYIEEARKEQIRYSHESTRWHEECRTGEAAAVILPCDWSPNLTNRFSKAQLEVITAKNESARRNLKKSASFSEKLETPVSSACLTFQQNHHVSVGTPFENEQVQSSDIETCGNLRLFQTAEIAHRDAWPMPSFSRLLSELDEEEVAFLGSLARP